MICLLPLIKANLLAQSSLIFLKHSSWWTITFYLINCTLQALIKTLSSGLIPISITYTNMFLFKARSLIIWLLIMVFLKAQHWVLCSSVPLLMTFPKLAHNLSFIFMQMILLFTLLTLILHSVLSAIRILLITGLVLQKQTCPQ